MESWEINGSTLEYDDETHTYLVDGIIVPSVTQILSVKFGGKYSQVDKETLKQAAVRGTNIHKEIETFCKEGSGEGVFIRNFKFLLKHYSLTPIENEVPIILWKDEPIAAGRLDLIFDQDGETALADIKTTAALDKEYLAYQLNLYRIGYRQSYGIECTKLYGVHLREDKRKLVPIPVNEKLAWSIVDEYERSIL